VSPLLRSSVAGCGGGSSSSTTGASGASGASGSAPLSQSEFVSQANAACKDANDQLAALKAPAQTLSAQATTIAQEIPIINQGLAKLTAITPPTDLQSKYDQWLSQAKQQVTLATQLAAAAKANDTAKAQAAAKQLQANSEQNNSLATDLGLTECAKNVSPQG
jgi:chromosome segregation ATPase